MKTTNYVLGFLFDYESEEVVLIRKNKPDWQRGLLNGVGGKIEASETPENAMDREFLEEAGSGADWELFCIMRGHGFRVYCFRSFDSDAVDKCKTVTDEEIVKVNPFCLCKNHCIENIPWLVALAMDQNNGNPIFANVKL